VKTKTWNGYGVDADLNADWLERLNNLSWDLTSICCGHPDATQDEWVYGYAGNPNPNFDIISHSGGDVKLSLKIKEELKKLPNTKAYTRWIYKSGGFVHNGEYKDDSFDRIVVGVDSTIKNLGNNQKELDGWWEQVILKIEEFIKKDY